MTTKKRNQVIPAADPGNPNFSTLSSIETAMLNLRSSAEDSTVKDFFTAWCIPMPVIAERIRSLGFDASAKQIEMILKSEQISRSDLYLLSIVMMEIRNDIIKILYH